MWTSHTPGATLVAEPNADKGDFVTIERQREERLPK